MLTLLHFECFTTLEEPTKQLYNPSKQSCFMSYFLNCGEDNAATQLNKTCLHPLHNINMATCSFETWTHKLSQEHCLVFHSKFKAVHFLPLSWLSPISLDFLLANLSGTVQSAIVSHMNKHDKLLLSKLFVFVNFGVFLIYILRYYYENGINIFTSNLKQVLCAFH